MKINNIKKCLAKTRQGLLCQSPVVRGRNRCRMHGGAKGSGAPLGNQNAFKHGLYSAETIQIKQQLQRLLRDTKEVLKEIPF